MSAQADILAAVKTALEGITQANGYSLDVRKVRRGLVDPKNLRDLPALVYYREELNREDLADDFDQELRLGVVGWAVVAAGSDDFSALEALEEAVMQALMNRESNPYWANTTFGNISYFEQGTLGNLAGFDLAVNISFDAAD